MTFEQRSSSLVLHQMMSDHNSSDLAPQRQEMSVENVSSGLVPQGQKASDYDNSDPLPLRQNVVPTAEKTDSSKQGLEFLFSPLLEEYYNPTQGLAEENNNDQIPNLTTPPQPHPPPVRISQKSQKNKQTRTRESEEFKKNQKSTKPKPEKSSLSQIQCPQLDQTATIDAWMIEEMIGQD
ncbi:hypothetical protein Tco_0970854 [Tanacetum coccineum]